MKSPYAPYAEAELKWQLITEKYKGEEFEIIEIYWLDPVTGHTFDTVETGDATVNQVYNAYRVRHGLPFPDELTSLRQHLGLSAAKMSTLLGLGINQYRLYEKGDMPVDAVGKYLRMLIGNKSALRDCIENSKSILSTSEYKTAMNSLDNDHYDMGAKMLQKSRDKSNGYAPLNPNRIQNVILHFFNKMGALSPTYLNKLLFYTDFMAYRTKGMAITGLSYRALPYGPVPDNWKYIPLIANIEQEEAEIGTLLSSDTMADYSCFSASEIDILNKIAERFKGMTATAISELSHQENAWKESRSDTRSPISFDYAFSLKAI